MTTERLEFAEDDEPEEAPVVLNKEARAKPVVKIERVTTKLAEQWLSYNTHNRDLREERVLNLASALQRNEGELTGDCVCWDTQGILLNGQHRLNAIVVSGIPMDLVVLRGLPSKAQEVMDQNLKRSIGDALRLRRRPDGEAGEKYANQLGAMLAYTYRFDYIYQTGRVHYLKGVRPSTPQLLRVFDRDPEGFRIILSMTMKTRKEVMIRTGVMAALWYRFNLIDVNEAQQFFTTLESGAMLAVDDPIYVLRRLIQGVRSNPARTIGDFREAAVIILAWNFWRDQQPVRQLRWHYGPSQQDPFPVPQ